MHEVGTCRNLGHLGNKVRTQSVFAGRDVHPLLRNAKSDSIQQQQQQQQHMHVRTHAHTRTHACTHARTHTHIHTHTHTHTFTHTHTHTRTTHTFTHTRTHTRTRTHTHTHTHRVNGDGHTSKENRSSNRQQFGSLKTLRLKMHTVKNKHNQVQLVSNDQV